MHDKRVALVTGANQGIGLQIAKELAAKGFTVLVGSRNLARGEEATCSVSSRSRRRCCRSCARRRKPASSTCRAASAR